jgi:hypothetical protein
MPMQMQLYVFVRDAAVRPVHRDTPTEQRQGKPDMRDSLSGVGRL